MEIFSLFIFFILSLPSTFNRFCSSIFSFLFLPILDLLFSTIPIFSTFIFFLLKCSKMFCVQQELLGKNEHKDYIAN